MDLQSIIGYGIGMIALVTMIRIFIKQFKAPEVDAHCDGCPVDDAKEDL